MSSPSVTPADSSVHDLGNMLQRLALLAPEKLEGIRLIVRAVLRAAEDRYRRRFRRDPWTRDGPVNPRTR